MSKLIRTFFLTCQTPYPPIGGAAIRNWQTINVLKQLGPVALFSVPLSFNKVETGSKLPDIEFWEEYIPGKAVKKGLKKYFQLFEASISHGVNSYYTNDIAKLLDLALTRFQPDLVIISEIGMAPYLEIVRSHQCKVVFDDHNVESQLFWEKSNRVRGVKRKIQNYIKFCDLKAVEQKTIERVDQVWFCSDIDCRIASKLYGETSLVRVVPNGIDMSYYAQVPSRQGMHPYKTEYHDKTILFIGTFGYFPNKIAAQWLIEEIFPCLQDVCSNSRMILAGAQPTDQMLEAHKRNPNIIVTGRVEDLRPYIAQASIVVIPLLHGGGTRLKILEAFASGRAVVSTSKGAEGLSVVDGQHLLIRDSVGDLVAGVCEVWDNPRLAQHLVENALELVKSQYSWDAIASQIHGHVNQLF